MRRQYWGTFIPWTNELSFPASPNNATALTLAREHRYRADLGLRNRSTQIKTASPNAKHLDSPEAPRWAHLEHVEQVVDLLAIQRNAVADGANDQVVIVIFHFLKHAQAMPQTGLLDQLQNRKGNERHCWHSFQRLGPPHW